MPRNPQDRVPTTLRGQGGPARRGVTAARELGAGLTDALVHLFLEGRRGGQKPFQAALNRGRDREIAVGDQVQSPQRLVPQGGRTVRDQPSELELGQTRDLREPRERKDQGRRALAERGSKPLRILSLTVVREHFVGDQRPTSRSTKSAQCDPLVALEKRAGGISGIDRHQATGSPVSRALQRLEIQIPASVN